MVLSLRQTLFRHFLRIIRALIDPMRSRYLSITFFELARSGKSKRLHGNTYVDSWWRPSCWILPARIPLLM